MPYFQFGRIGEKARTFEKEKLKPDWKWQVVKSICFCVVVYLATLWVLDHFSPPPVQKIEYTVTPTEPWPPFDKWQERFK